MAQLKLVPPPLRAFSLAKWGPVVPALCDEYRTGQPSPHICLADFLDDDAALMVARELAALPGWLRSKPERKWPISQRGSLPHEVGRIVDELNSPAFVEWIGDLAGTPHLIADPAVVAGGLQQVGAGESLDLISTAASHPLQENWSRRIALVLYLTPQWQAEWRGAMEFWDGRTRTCAAHYPSLFNHAVIFSANDRCLSGFSDPLVCPAGVMRRSLTLYYYTLEEARKPVTNSASEERHSTLGWGKGTLTWLRRRMEEYSNLPTRSMPALARMLRFSSKGN